jgi:hypothetical protein
MKDQAAGRPPHLSDFARHHVTHLHCVCANLTCRHGATVPIADIVRRLGPDATIVDARRVIYCSKCGSRQVQLQPSWPDPMKGAARGAAI